MPDPGDLWQLPFVREAAAELLLLALAAGPVGAWIVLRRRAFFAHAVGAATFPGLVIAAAAGLAAPALALGTALLYAAGVAALGRRGPDARGEGQGAQVATALLLVAALAGGIVLASDVFASGAEVDRLLFGTLLGLETSDLLVAAAAAGLALAATAVLGRAWVALGFDPSAASLLPVSPALADALLLALIAVVAVAALPAVGALLITALLIVPAATVRLFASSVGALLAAAPALAAVEALLGLYASLWLDVPPGPALAVLAAGVYLAAMLARVAMTARHPLGAAA